MLDYRTNIESLADTLVASHGIEAVKAVYARYDATGIDNLRPSHLCEVFSDLMQIYADD